MLQLHCLFRCRYCNPLYNRYVHSGCPSWLSCISVIFQTHLGASLKKVLHAVHSYRVTLQCHKIYGTMNTRYIHIYEKSQFNSLVWGSLMLTPNSLNRLFPHINRTVQHATESWVGSENEATSTKHHYITDLQCSTLTSLFSWTSRSCW